MSLAYRVDAAETAEEAHFDSLLVAVREASRLARETKGDVRIYAGTELLHLIKCSNVLHLVSDAEIDQAVSYLPDAASSADEPRAITSASVAGRVRIVFRRFQQTDGAVLWVPTDAQRV